MSFEDDRNQAMIDFVVAMRPTIEEEMRQPIEGNTFRINHGSVRNSLDDVVQKLEIELAHMALEVYLEIKKERNT